MASDQRAEVINSQGDVSQTEISVTFIDLIQLTYRVDHRDFVTHLRVPIFLFRHHVLQNRLKMGEYASRTMAMETTNVNV